MNFAESLLYIEKQNSVGSIFGLERVQALDRLCGSPSKKLSIVHVAGTNGKGSFCAFFAQILMEAGYKVGRYISPTIFDYRERIQVNGQWIDEASVSKYMMLLSQKALEVCEQGLEHPTAFEIETVMSFLYFADQSCDFVILEAGLGGLTDSTNMIDPPVLSVITSISYDHTAVLGNTLEEIASQKAGIIKGNPVVVYNQNPSVMEVIKDTCAKKDSELFISDVSLVDGYELGLQGLYQRENAAGAICGAKVLQKLGYAIDDCAIEKAIKKTKWPGRFEVVYDAGPTIIVDGAHNPDGARTLKESLVHLYKDRPVILLAGIFADKDYKAILNILSSVSDTLITHRPPVNRGLEAKALAEAAKDDFKYVYDATSIKEGLHKAMEMASKDTVIVSFGSLSTIKLLYEAVEDLR